MANPLPDDKRMRDWRRLLQPEDYPGREAEIEAIRAGAPMYNILDVIEEMKERQKKRSEPPTTEGEETHP